ncbi:MAG: hypothetical protein K6E30_00185 [Lachnospiraceae bacterium]|nr:hypothetical protein [Lachnospiraceae bacterium]
MTYEKDRFINNIYALAKGQKLKIGELEAACGVSVGYFARLRQGTKDAAPAANLLMLFADRLSVSADALLSFDFTQATESEQKLLNYMEKLRFETETRKLSWQRDPGSSPAHPLFMEKEGLLTEEERAEMDLPESVSLSESVYRSPFRPDLDDLVPAAIYRCYFPGKRTLYLAAVVQPNPALPASAQPADLELVMVDSTRPEPIPFARTDHENPGFLDKALISLFTAVKKAIDFPSLRPDAEAIIDDYLK